ncbi:MAG: hypothetical protein R3Y56_09115 [Akkermansia sp.]
MLRFSLLRVPIIIHPSLWMILLLFSVLAEQSTDWHIVHISTFVAAGFISLLAHEMGHALTGQWLGGGRAQVYLEWLGGSSWNPDAKLTRTGGLLMTAAGPFANILIGVASFTTLYLVLGSTEACKDCLDGSYEYSCMVSTGGLCLLRNLGVISIFWAAFNLLPVYPLDGGQLCAGLMKSMRLVLSISIAVAFVMFLVCLVLGKWVLMFFFAALAFFNYKRRAMEPY